MHKIFKALLAVSLLTTNLAAVAQDHNPMMNHQEHMAAMQQDARELVNFPPEMRQHTLANMRDHLMALSDILAAMSGGRYANAAAIADQRLGLGSPSADGCKPEGNAPQMSKPARMDHQMAQFMPEGMRQIGLNMHEAASAFAKEASKAVRTGNAKPALASLSRVTEQCAACHLTYKVQ